MLKERLTGPFNTGGTEVVLESLMAIVHVKDPVTEPLRPSLAMISVVSGLEACAAKPMVPEMSPAEEMERPSGSPVAVKVSVSESGSENAVAIENEI